MSAPALFVVMTARRYCVENQSRGVACHNAIVPLFADEAWSITGWSGAVTATFWSGVLVVSVCPGAVAGNARLSETSGKKILFIFISSSGRRTLNAALGSETPPRIRAMDIRSDVAFQNFRTPVTLATPRLSGQAAHFSLSSYGSNKNITSKNINYLLTLYTQH